MQRLRQHIAAHEVEIALVGLLNFLGQVRFPDPVKPGNRLGLREPLSNIDLSTKDAGDPLLGKVNLHTVVDKPDRHGTLLTEHCLLHPPDAASLAGQKPLTDRSSDRFPNRLTG